MPDADSAPRGTVTAAPEGWGARVASHPSWWWLPCWTALAAFVLIEITLRRGLPVNPDGWWYWQGALGLAEGRGYIGLHGEPLVAWPVGFSWWLSLWIRGFGDSAGTLIHALATATAVAAAGWTLLAQRVQSSCTTQAGLLPIVAVAVFLPCFLALQVRALHAETLLDALLPWTLLAALSSGRGWLAMVATAVGFALCLLIRNSAPVFLPGLVYLVYTAGDRSTRRRIARTTIFCLLALGLAATARLLTGPGPGAMLGNHGTHPIGGARLDPLSQSWELLLGIDKAFGPKYLGILLFLVLCHVGWRTDALLRRLEIFTASSLLLNVAIFALVYIHDPLEGRFLRYAPALLVPTILLAGRWPRPRWFLVLVVILLAGIPMVRAGNHAWKGRGPDPAAASREFAPRPMGLRNLL